MKGNTNTYGATFLEYKNLLNILSSSFRHGSAFRHSFLLYILYNNFI